MFDFRLHAALFAIAHLTTVFYARSFRWSDWYSFSCKIYANDSIAITKFLLLALCLEIVTTFKISSLEGSALTTVLAFPQLYRQAGERNRNLRIVLGPLTPFLAINNILQDPSLVTTASLVVCVIAFVILRPDNTTVLDLFLPNCQFLRGSKNRRKLHGYLAATNSFMAAFVVLYAVGIQRFLVKEYTSF